MKPIATYVMRDLTTKTLIAMAVTLIVGVAGGWFVGRYVGYTDGVVKGSAAGFQMGGNAVMLGKIRYEVEKLPPESRNLGEAMCAGFRSQLPCRSVAEADRLIMATDPLDRLLGQSCKSSLQSLGACGEGYQAPMAN